MNIRPALIFSNDEIADKVYKMVMMTNCTDYSNPGQFVNIKIDGFYLRRPISVTSYTAHQLTIIYKVVGEGTKKMSEMVGGNELELLAPLGNGYDLNKIGENPLLVGGGAGVPPMIGLAKALVKENGSPKVILGFNSAADVFGIEDFQVMGINPIITTVDGSYGQTGFVTDAMNALKYDYDYVCACGPEPMLKATYDLSPDGQFSFEARMACGFGACMGCSCETKYGSKRICTDGPVLFKEEIIW